MVPQHLHRPFRLLWLATAEAGYIYANAGLTVNTPHQPKHVNPILALAYDGTLVSAAALFLVLLGAYLVLALVTLTLSGKVPKRVGPVELQNGGSDETSGGTLIDHSQESIEIIQVLLDELRASAGRERDAILRIAILEAEAAEAHLPGRAHQNRHVLSDVPANLFRYGRAQSRADVSES